MILKIIKMSNNVAYVFGMGDSEGKAKESLEQRLKKTNEKLDTVSLELGNHNMCNEYYLVWVDNVVYASKTSFEDAIEMGKEFGNDVMSLHHGAFKCARSYELASKEYEKYEMLFSAGKKMTKHRLEEIDLRAEITAGMMNTSKGREESKREIKESIRRTIENEQSYRVSDKQLYVRMTI